MKTPDIRVVGAGLAGAELTLQLAAAGFEVQLHEMKPKKMSPAHVDTGFAELVCSNSFRSNSPENAVGLLKEEMRRAGSFMLRAAEVAKVPAGDALAVDRKIFSKEVARLLQDRPNISIVEDEVKALFDDEIPTVYATGPLTAEPLAQDIAQKCGRERLAFYDAIAPIVDADSIDFERAFRKSRYDKGEGDDYVNCPMTSEEYETFLAALLDADPVGEKDFEKLHYFEGCLPLEEMAQRGPQTLVYGPMKPVGLEHPVDGTLFHGVIQLRKENVHGTAYNLVGCQTRLRQPDQKRIFRMVPGLENAVFLRYGAIHHNTYLDSPALLKPNLSLNGHPTTYFAGQITGVEGYVESMACGMLVSWTLAATLRSREFEPPPRHTALGGLYRHVLGVDSTGGRFQPSNVNWSLVAPLEERVPKREKKRIRSERALQEFGEWRERNIEQFAPGDRAA